MESSPTLILQHLTPSQTIQLNLNDNNVRNHIRFDDEESTVMMVEDI